MKRPKRSSPNEQKSDPMQDLNIDLESPDDDDDIIDLEDILEMPDRPIDEDEDLDLNAEIFDVDSHPEHEPPKIAQPPTKGRPQAIASSQEDLLESLGDEPEEEETLFDAAASGGLEEQPDGKGESQLFDILDIEDDSLLDEFLDKPAKAGRGKKLDLKARTAAALKITEEARSADIEPDAPIFDEPSATAPTGTPVPPPADLLQTVEELIGRIESRLQEHIRVMVESRLPDLVRSVIGEEIEKLKRNLL